MSVRSRETGSWLDPFAAAVPGAAAAWSAALLAPLFDIPAAVVSPLAGLAMFVAGWGAMRLAAPRPAPFALPTADCVGKEDGAMLDQRLAASMDALAELILDDPLPAPSAASRVVQLFPAQPAACAGDLKRRIDLHLGLESVVEQRSPGDAADSLRRALDELRQTIAER